MGILLLTFVLDILWSVMVYFLATNSKLLPGAPSRPETPLDAADLIVWHHMVRSLCWMHFYDSDFVLASLMTKSRIIEDDRNIPLPRVRNGY